MLRVLLDRPWNFLLKAEQLLSQPIAYRPFSTTLLTTTTRFAILSASPKESIAIRSLGRPLLFGAYHEFSLSTLFFPPLHAVVEGKPGLHKKVVCIKQVGGKAFPPLKEERVLLTASKSDLLLG